MKLTNENKCWFKKPNETEFFEGFFMSVTNTGSMVVVNEKTGQVELASMVYFQYINDRDFTIYPPQIREVDFADKRLKHFDTDIFIKLIPFIQPDYINEFYISDIKRVDNLGFFDNLNFLKQPLYFCEKSSPSKMEVMFFESFKVIQSTKKTPTTSEVVKKITSINFSTLTVKKRYSFEQLANGFFYYLTL